MLQVVSLYLDGADGTLSRVYVGRVVHVGARLLLQLLEHRREFGEGATFQLVAQGLVLGHGRELVALQHRLDVEPRAAAEDGLRSPTLHFGVGLMEVLLILEEIVLRAGLADVDEVIRHVVAFHDIVVEVLARSDSHAAIHLPRVATEDFGLLSF